MFNLPIIPDYSLLPLNLNSIGDNQRGILIVYLTEKGKAEAKMEEDFLKKVFSAVQLDLDKDTLMINLSIDSKISFRKLKSGIDFEKVYFFGLSPENLDWHIKPVFYNPFSFGGKEVLFCDAVEKIINNKEKKGLLWKALKYQFLNK